MWIRSMLAAVALVAASPLAGDVRGTRDTMDSILENIRVLLELSVAENGLARPENRDRVVEALAQLEDQAAILSSHGFPDKLGADFLASALQRYVTLMARTYDWGAPDQTEELLYQTTDICIACHTRLRGTSRAPSADDFIDSASLSVLPLERRVNLEVATRRFDSARTTMESWFVRGPDAPVDTELLRRVLTTYLVVNVRVLGDYTRPLGPLEVLSRRTDLDAGLRASLLQWTESLRWLTESAPLHADLQTGRALVEAGDAREQAVDNGGLVLYIAASGVLQEMIEEHSWSDAILAEAYYRLGAAQYHIEWEEWIPQAELYLESAILVAPSGKWARPAFELLERKVRASMAAHGEGELPPEVQSHLDSLERSIDAK